MNEYGVSQAQHELHALVDQCVTDGEVFTITKNGNPCAVLIGVDEYEAMKALVVRFG